MNMSPRLRQVKALDNSFGTLRTVSYAGNAGPYPSVLEQGLWCVSSVLFSLPPSPSILCIFRPDLSLLPGGPCLNLIPSSPSFPYCLVGSKGMAWFFLLIA